MEPINKGTLQVVKSMPDFTFPAYNFEKKGSGPPQPPSLSRASTAVDLGTPNLGTAWRVNSISLFYETLGYKFNNSAGTQQLMSFYIVSYLFVGGQEMFREASEKISKTQPPNTSDESNTFTSLLALQNLPNPITVPGGQQLVLEMAISEQTAHTIFNFVGGEMKRGKVTMTYDLLDYHKKPRRYLAR